MAQVSAPHPAVRRLSPGALASLLGLAVFVVWALRNAGDSSRQWTAGGLMLLALVAVRLPESRAAVWAWPRLVKASVGCLAAYTVLSFLSVLWAQAPWVALEGADRTLVYLIVFAAFACWLRAPRDAGVWLAAWALAMAAVACYVVVRLDVASPSELQGLLPGGRLALPSEYPNANAALLLMAFWPAVVLVRDRRTPWWARSAASGGAVVLAEVALLAESRGALLASGVMIGLMLAVLRDRTRTFAVLAPVLLAVGLAAPAVLAVGERVASGANPSPTVHWATAATVAAAVAVAAVVGGGAWYETREHASKTTTAVRRWVSVAAVGTGLAAAAVVLVAVGNPITEVPRDWQSFQGGYAADRGAGDRLFSGFGSNRYDIYRVALDEFLSHPLLGIGADNFQQQYRRRRRSRATPRYPHSVELRTLTETGLVGAVIGVVGLGTGLAATLRAARSQPPDTLASAVAGAALAGFAYWLVHGSVDWFWEIAGLGAPAFALLGIACGMACATATAPSHPTGTPGTQGGAPSHPTSTPAAHGGAPDERPPRSSGIPSGRPLGMRTCGVVLLLAAACLATQWLR